MEEAFFPEALMTQIQHPPVVISFYDGDDDDDDPDEEVLHNIDNIELELPASTSKSS